MAKKLPSGNYRQRVTYYDESGERRSESFTADTESEADYLASEFKFRRKRESKSNTMTVGLAVNNYIEMKDSVLSPSTIKGYVNIAKDKIEPVRNIRITDLSSVNLQIWVNDMNKTLSRKTVLSRLSLVTSAVKTYLPDKSFRLSLPQKTKTEVVVPSEKEMQKIFNYIKGKPLETEIMLAALCGLRRSEISGLIWSDIDFKKKKIHIQRAVVRDRYNLLVEKTTKSFDSNRLVDVPDRLLEVLKSSKANKNQKPSIVDPNTITKKFPLICKELKLQHFNFHLLRHYYASLLISMGIPLAYISHLLGHGSENMIKKVYGHIMKDKEDEFRKTILKRLND